jgi:hypothetical protein
MILDNTLGETTLILVRLWILSLCAITGVNTPSIKKNLVSASLLCWDGFKLVFESNKVVISRYGQFIGKGYDSRGLFRFSLSDFYNKVVNHMCDPNNSMADILLVLLNANRNKPQAHRSTVLALHPEVFRVSYFPQGPTWQPPSSRFVLVSFRVFHALLVPLSDPFAQVVMLWLDCLRIQPCFLYLIPAK